MGYALTMFGMLMVISVSMITAATYGVAKDSQTAPLKAENTYAEIQTGKAQTSLTIVNTCLMPDSSLDRYTKAQGIETSGPYSLYLKVRNSGSIVLNPINSAILYNGYYINFNIPNSEDKHDEIEEFCGDTSGYFKAWPPMTNVCMNASSITIATPDMPAPGDELRLLLAAENGVSTIAPTSPTNFTGFRTPDNDTYAFSWNASDDEDGIAYYRLYAIDAAGDVGNCPPKTYTIQQIPGNKDTFNFQYSLFCKPCNADLFFLTAVDNLQNEGIQSRTIKCVPVADRPCVF